MATHDLSAHAHHKDEGEHNRSGERRTLYVVLLAAVMMVGELIVGSITESTALKADGWHMGTHVGALGLTLVAYWYARHHAGSDAFSFGTGKVYALAGYTSGIVLVIVALWLGVEGVEKLITFEKPDYDDALPVAILGLIVNLGSAWLLGSSHHYGHDHGHAHGHDHADGHDHAHGHAHEVRAPRRDAKARLEAGTLDFNMRAAYIHIVADALTSVLAIVALALGKWTDLWFLDPLMGPVGGVVIIWWSVGLCRQASRQLLDVVSSPKHEEVVRRQLEAIDDVKVADLHVWELGPGKRSCIVSVVTATPRDLTYYRDAVLTALPVAHLTIEIHQCELPHAEPH
ncbi:MAG TPA: CDF family Co(II)/Ni(II) efflux transporter DmeF [Kofleriaceae bacterium]